jgi:hypothetical protein
MKAVILQPFYLPWAGYFGMIDIADVFVFYDDVQFVKQSWQQRNKIKIQNKPGWLTIPVNKKFGQKINEVKINNSIKWKEKHWKSIFYSYAKAPHFGDFKNEIEDIYNKEWDYLSDLNIHLIEKISKMLGLEIPHFIKSSDITDLHGKKTDRILSILEKIGADEYISGPAAKDYIEIQKFKDKNITLYWYEFFNPVYPQIGTDFLPFLSVIDILFNTGEKSRDYIRKSLKNSLQLEGGIINE